MKHARIVDDIAVDVCIGDPLLSFAFGIASQFVPVPDEVEPQWRRLQVITNDQLTSDKDWFSQYTSIEEYEEDDGNGAMVTKYRYRVIDPPELPRPVSSVPSWSDADLDPRYHWIDVGPFMDRFGAKAVTVAGSNDATVRGMVLLMQPRKYIDLKRADVASFIGILRDGKGLITESEANAILSPITTDAERHVKGLTQPTD